MDSFEDDRAVGEVRVLLFLSLFGRSDNQNQGLAHARQILYQGVTPPVSTCNLDRVTSSLFFDWLVHTKNIVELSWTIGFHLVPLETVFQNDMEELVSRYKDWRLGSIKDSMMEI
jgi:hypothetical protein